MTSDSFLSALRRRAAVRRRTVAFPEGTEPRVLEAAAEIAREGLALPLLIGDPDQVGAGLSERGVDVTGYVVVDPSAASTVERTLEFVRARRAHRDDAPERLQAMARDPLFQAGMLVGTGEADGAVGGCVRTTGDVIRAALVCVGLAEGCETLSSSFYMAFPEEHPVGPAVLTFTDAGVVPEPTATQLTDIAVAASDARPRIVGDEAAVAFLSYSTHGSADGPAVRAVRDAVADFRRRRPGVPADGEIQADAALSETVAVRKAPESPLKGRANVLVFPDLNAANIGYKLVQYLGGAVALGPVLQGLARPYNDLSRGALASDIVAVTCITSLMAGPGNGPPPPA